MLFNSLLLPHHFFPLLQLLEKGLSILVMFWHLVPFPLSFFLPPFADTQEIWSHLTFNKVSRTSILVEQQEASKPPRACQHAVCGLFLLYQKNSMLIWEQRGFCLCYFSILQSILPFGSLLESINYF